MNSAPSGVSVNADASTETLMVVPRSAVAVLTCAYVCANRQKTDSQNARTREALVRQWMEKDNHEKKRMKKGNSSKRINIGSGVVMIYSEL